MADPPVIADGSHNGGPSQKTSSPQTEQIYVAPCDICDAENLPESYSLPCRHNFCRKCLVSLFDTSLRSSSFPARCCGVLSIDEYMSALPQDLVRRYKEREEELATMNPTYCHHTPCNTFIPPRRIVGGVGNCPKCGMNTCETCKQAAHDGDCLEEDEEAIDKFLEFVCNEGWKQCPRCGHVIELKEGCCHMT
ncbi:hypothetical protein F4824DRAFT_416047 [Ustulina deusta]|nr:hypothetical protein F4824DRAFT_416047 [Ustulina deusta]